MKETPSSLPPSNRLNMGKWRPVCTQNLLWESLTRAVFISLHPLVEANLPWGTQ